ncbi:hypothetical protein KY326_03600 [Candidatus Woesearchaeota archaeon]|nr:hypothetical protein [Candidatus Woesearchaeota archaeon]
MDKKTKKKIAVAIEEAIWKVISDVSTPNPFDWCVTFEESETEEEITLDNEDAYAEGKE